MKSNKLAIYQWLVFVAAFLLFSVQPLVGKFILPWFGGSPSVWITAVMFFQVVLLAGYVFAYFISHLKRPHQFIVYSLILLAALFFLPITPDNSWQICLLDRKVIKLNKYARLMFLVRRTMDKIL